MAPDEARAVAIGLWEQGDSASAVTVLKDHLETGAGDCLAWSDLGVLLFSLGAYVGAEHSFARALHFDGDFPAALRGRSESLLRLQRYAEALGGFERYRQVAANDSQPAALSHAECLCECNRLSEALNLIDANIGRNVESTAVQMLMARIYQRQRLPGQMLQAVQNAVTLAPENSEVRAQLAIAYWEFGKTEEAIRELRLLPARHTVPQTRPLNSSWLFLHDPDQEPSALRRVHEANASSHLEYSATLSLAPRHKKASGPLRIGYISGEFKGGPAFCFLAPWLKRFDRERFHSTFYSSRPGSGRKWLAFQRMADTWRTIEGLPNADLVKLIRSDEIDILVDLSGHYDGNRLEVFRSRVAPVQVTFPNYPSTTGVEQIDYLLTDCWATPMGCEQEYVETPYRLPSGYLVYEPACDSPPVTSLPKATNGFTTFGLFQRPGKYHAKFWDMVGSLMAALPDAHLLIHFASFELDDALSEQRRFLTATLAARSIGQDRLTFIGVRSESEHMQVVAQADIALDSFPYNGQTTTCDCLWMGVPVVTLRGKTHVSRIGGALLDRMGLGGLAAQSIEGYIESAIELSSDPVSLAQLRLRLRQELQTHLGDGARLAQEISSAYVWMWERSGGLPS